MLDRRTFSLAALSALLGFAAWAATPAAAEPRPAARPTAGGFTCPLTGEELPSPDCCPLTQAKAKTNCCQDPDCLPGCCPECPPDCCAATGARAEPARPACPPDCQDPACCPGASRAPATVRGAGKSACPPCPFCP